MSMVSPAPRSLDSAVSASATAGRSSPAATDAAHVELHEICLSYGEDSSQTLALENLSLSIAPGEFVAVVGPSGCGKSTLMKLVTGLISPDSGQVRYEGQPVKGPVAGVGMAFQNSTLMPWRTTLENVLLPFEIVKPHKHRLRRHRKEYVDKAMQLLAKVGLQEFADKYPWELSGGMQQRTSVCRALVHEPRLLMLDEPFGALDAFTREELWLMMQELWIEKRFSAVLVTHDLREAVFLADRVIVLSRRPGRVLMERRIERPRPRPIASIYEGGFGDIVKEIRRVIVEA